MGKPMHEPIHPYIRALICQIRAIRDHVISPSSRLTLDEVTAVEGAFMEAAACLRKGRNSPSWHTYRPDPRNGTVFVQAVTVPDGPDGTGPLATFYDVMHESASADSYGTCETFVTREAAEAAALQEAIQRNAIYEPGKTTVDAVLTVASSSDPEGGAA